jgi:hypothetical protein
MCAPCRSATPPTSAASVPYPTFSPVTSQANPSVSAATGTSV